MIVGDEEDRARPGDMRAARATARGAATTRPEAQNSAPGLHEMTLTIEAAAQLRALLGDPNTPRHEGATLPTIEAATLLRRH